MIVIVETLLSAAIGQISSDEKLEVKVKKKEKKEMEGNDRYLVAVFVAREEAFPALSSCFQIKSPVESNPGESRSWRVYHPV